MSFIYLLLTILVIFVIWKIFLFAFKGGNFHLIPRNIARVYKTVKSKFNDKYNSDTELLFIAGIINAKIYIRKDESLIEKIYLAAKSCSNLQDETRKISDFAQILMQEYFLQDSKMGSSEIAMAINERRKKIDRSVFEELKSKKYFPENTIEKDIPIVKEYYSHFEANKNQ
ncbi:hypothetical protein KJ636_03575 [Patescibacteria group bacterium]|nr:hypothetical protein [Patescibacteria group bacterium]